MDPGQEVMKSLKTVPNLVSEEPSTITPANTSFVDLPWSDFSQMLAQKSKTTADKLKESKSHQSQDYSPAQPDKGPMEDFTLGNWDASTGYQDKQHGEEVRNHLEEEK